MNKPCTENFLKWKQDAQYPHIDIREVPYLVKHKTPRRNSKCPCNSGLKYKQCHLLMEKQKNIDINLTKYEQKQDQVEG